MTRLPRPALVAGAVVAQLAFVGFAVAPRLSARLSGEEYRLAISPVDPIDPFRGAYVTLRYDDLPDYAPIGGDVFVPLVRDGALWRGAGVERARPVSGPYLACRSEGVIECGIESWFVPQDEARRLERDLAGGGVATIRVDDRGNAVLVAVSPG